WWGTRATSTRSNICGCPSSLFTRTSRRFSRSHSARSSCTNGSRCAWRWPWPLFSRGCWWCGNTLIHRVVSQHLTHVAARFPVRNAVDKQFLGQSLGRVPPHLHPFLVGVVRRDGRRQRAVETREVLLQQVGRQLGCDLGLDQQLVRLVDRKLGIELH